MNYGTCPRCNHGTLFKDNRTGDVECYSCGYEMLLSVPIGMNTDYWHTRSADKSIAAIGVAHPKVRRPA